MEVPAQNFRSLSNWISRLFHHVVIPYSQIWSKIRLSKFYQGSKSHYHVNSQAGVQKSNPQAGGSPYWANVSNLTTPFLSDAGNHNLVLNQKKFRKIAQKWEFSFSILLRKICLYGASDPTPYPHLFIVTV